VAPRSLGRSDQEYWLFELADLGSDAAACCLQVDEVDRAVELWEQGRGVLLSQALDSRTDLTRLGEQHPQLAAEFIRLRDELDRLPDIDVAATPALPTRIALPASGDPDLVRRQADRRRELAKQFDQLVAKIRAYGFDRFLKPLPLAELLPAADHGPVVLINVSSNRSDALLLTASGVQVVRLPGLTPAIVRDQVVAFLAALDDVHDPAAGPVERDRAEQELTQILGWLWDVIAAPVLERLGIVGPPADGQLPQLWWCPSGLLAFLPLHAAGHHSTRFDAAPQTVLDRVVSSYTPTVRALIHARRPRLTQEDERVPREADRLLVVAMPHTPAAADLPGAADEAALVHDLFPGHTRILTGQEATYDSVGAALPCYRWAHFACHATSDPANPSASHLLLHDHQRRRLTVVDLTRLRLDDAELAFLSACATARTGTELADEAIQLAAGFQLAGYRHVIATLWPIGDRPAVRIANDVYRSLVAQSAEVAAWALHEATRRRRDLDAGRPSTWAAHIHSGA
jgi:hypothetical protein